MLIILNTVLLSSVVEPNLFLSAPAPTLAQASAPAQDKFIRSLRVSDPDPYPDPDPHGSALV